VEEPDNSLLTGRKYYYYVTDDTYPSGEYPICPSLSHWQFPHEKYPETWPNDKVVSSVKAELRTNLADAVKARDNWCVVSARQDWLEHAHIVPVALKGWFDDKNMQVYVEPVNEAHGVDATANMIMLCHDLHMALDHHYWAPVPKRDNSGRKVWVAQFVATTNDVGAEHHGRALHIKGVASQLLLARFAMLILGRLTKFLDYYKEAGVLAVLTRKDKEVVEYVEPLKESVIQAIFNERKRANPNTPGGRSSKRSRGGTPRKAAGGLDGGTDDHALATGVESDSNAAMSQLSSYFNASMPPSPVDEQDGDGIRAIDWSGGAGEGSAFVFRCVSPLTYNNRKRRFLSLDIERLQHQIEQLKKAQDYNERRLRRRV
jgi:hypothetical protein